MLMDKETIAKYKQLKREMDAAYRIFRKSPTLENATRHTTASQAFTSFCVETMKTLTSYLEEDFNQKILEDFETYRVCRCCNTELLFKITDDRFVASSSFVPEFPGICFDCLVEHCCTNGCSFCAMVEDPSTCPFKEVRKVYLNK